MPRSYGKIEVGIWHDPVFQGLSQPSKIFWIYLCSSPHSNAAGVYPLNEQYAQVDLKYNSSQLLECFEELESKDLIERDGLTVLIKNWFQHNKPVGTNDAFAMFRAIAACPSDSLKAKALQGFIDCDSALSRKVLDKHKEQVSRILERGQKLSRQNFENRDDDQKHSRIVLEGDETKGEPEGDEKHSRTLLAEPEPEPEPDIGVSTETLDASHRSVGDEIQKLGSEWQPGFEDFWEQYPRKATETGSLTKGSKKNARSRFLALSPKNRVAAFSGLDAYKQAHPDGSMYVLHAERYLKNKRWEDDCSQNPPPNLNTHSRVPENQTSTRTALLLEEIGGDDEQQPARYAH